MAFYSLKHSLIISFNCVCVCACMRAVQLSCILYKSERKSGKCRDSLIDVLADKSPDYITG